MTDPARTSIYWRDITRTAGAADAPRLTGDALVEAIRNNLAESMRMRDEARSRLKLAREAGTVVLDVKTERLRPLAEAGPSGKLSPNRYGAVALADWARSVAEVAHWTEYLDWSKIQRGASAVAEPDARLPPERDAGQDDDDPIPF